MGFRQHTGCDGGGRSAWAACLLFVLLLFVGAPLRAQTPAPRQAAYPEGSSLSPARPEPTRAPPRRERIQRRVREPQSRPTRPSAPPSPSPRRTQREALGPEAPWTPPLPTAPTAVDDSRGAADEVVPLAPYGRLVKCELVFTVDSLTPRAPIIALVAEDVFWEGQRILPAGTEVFGRAVPLGGHRRIGDEGHWVLVVRNPAGGSAHGREWRVRGQALERAEVEVDTRGAGRSWRVDDGSPGLQGEVIDEASRERVELYVATVLSGAVRGLAAGAQDRVLAGGEAGRRGQTVATASLRNAGLAAVDEGTRAALDLLASQILAEVQRHGAYVRVPAGKTFYLLVEQTLDPREAQRGGPPR